MIETLSSPPKPFEAQAQLFKILTHPARLAILELLRDGEHCVCHLEAHLGFRQAFISQHLAVMREVGLILDRREGWNIYYRVADPGIYEILDCARKLAGQKEFAPELAEVACPCPHCSPHSELENQRLPSPDAQDQAQGISRDHGAKTEEL